MNDLFAEVDDNLTEVDPQKNYLEELVGEGRKFKTVEDLARGKYEADRTIKITNMQKDEMRRELLRLREEYQASASLRELVDQLHNKPSSNQTSSETPDANAEIRLPAIDPDEIESLVDRKIQARENERKRQANYDSVMSKLKEQYGNTYPSVLLQQSEELGLSREEINDLARKSPAAFFRTMGLDQSQQKDGFQSPPRSVQRSDSFKPNVPKRTWTYYQELKNKNPSLYWSPKIQTQQLKDYEDLGKAFEDGDFHSV